VVEELLRALVLLALYNRAGLVLVLVATLVVPPLLGWLVYKVLD
jgi:hypothetical protein